MSDLLSGYARSDLAWTAVMLVTAALMLWALVICVRKLSGPSAVIAAIVVIMIPGVGALLVLAGHYSGLLSAGSREGGV